MIEMTYKHLMGAIGRFVALESTSGLALLAASLLALVASNSPLAPWYDLLLATPVGFHAGPLHLDKPLLLWINDGLMALFFLVVGAEIKREMAEGELSSWRKAALPAVAALGGMVLPAAIYAFFNRGDPAALAGWAIPTATDIAFALAALAIMGSRLPPSLKVFLLALAIFDDLGAIVVIAVFYTSELGFLALALAGIVLAVMAVLNRLGVRSIAPYALLGVLLWILVLKSGVHATLAGIATALALPLGKGDDSAPLRRVERGLHPWTSFLVMPLFGFANAGLSLAQVRPGQLLEGVAGRIALGLFLGKQIRVFEAAALAIKLRLGERPEGASWAGLYGVSVFNETGFT